jgi:hypothetical protein
VVWGAWIAVVWLPLVALLTYERSSWVVVILPLAAGFLALFVVSKRSDDEIPYVGVERTRAEMFAVDHSPRLWKILLPSLLIAVTIDGGVAMYAADHAWVAGALFAAASAYFAGKLLNRTAARVKVREGSVKRASVGNSVAVWMLTVVALLPFLASVGMSMRLWMGMPQVQAQAAARPARAAAKDWLGIIMTRPRQRHEIVTPVLTTSVEAFSKSKVIPFDGQYWYFQPPDRQPGPGAHVVQGDPTKDRIRSTNYLAVMMEAHQRLPKEMEANCCQTLQLNVVNADAVPGSISVEVLLKDSSRKTGASVSLGNKVLASSTVSPMPLKRGPVHETLTFQIPRGSKQTFDEITVKVKPEFGRTLAAPHVGIESFAFQR